MVQNFQFPPVGFGPGSQPGEGEGDLAYLPMPSGMRTFHSPAPYVEDPDAYAGTVAALKALAALAGRWRQGDAPLVYDPSSLDAANRRLLGETLGEGEVAIVVEGDARTDIQESVFAGVWRVLREGRETIEVGTMASAVTHAPARPLPPMPRAAPGVVNAPAILTELVDAAAGNRAHSINLTLLPHTPEDLDHIAAALGDGGVKILSRGYGNCRVERTATPSIWRTRYFNSQDALILDLIEVGPVPEVTIAAPEDIADSAERLAEVAESIR